MAGSGKNADFVELLTSHQRRLYGYVATLAPNPSDCEEILQQVNLILWTKANEFEPGTSFRAWSFRIAYLEAIAFCRRRARERQFFGSQLVEMMASEIANRPEPDTERSIVALRRCLRKLTAADRKMITGRYVSEEKVRQMAAALGRPVSSVYRSLDRIRYALLKCIQESLATEDQE